jgi:hypothetical protein
VIVGVGSSTDSGPEAGLLVYQRHNAPDLAVPVWQRSLSSRNKGPTDLDLKRALFVLHEIDALRRAGDQV